MELLPTVIVGYVILQYLLVTVVHKRRMEYFFLDYRLLNDYIKIYLVIYTIFQLSIIHIVISTASLGQFKLAYSVVLVSTLISIVMALARSASLVLHYGIMLLLYGFSVVIALFVYTA